MMRNPIVRFSYRVALQMRCFDVEGMLDSGRPGQLNMWSAFEELEPFGREWDQTSLNTVELRNELYQIRKALLGEKVEQSELWEASKFIPRPRGVKHKKKTRKALIITPNALIVDFFRRQARV